MLISDICLFFEVEELFSSLLPYESNVLRVDTILLLISVA